MYRPLVSIIIPCKEVDHYAKACVDHYKRLDYDNHEILLLPDNALEKVDGVKIVSTGPVTPGAKRNIGVARSKGEIYAFIDSDAYPRRDWLNNAIKYFNDPQVAAVGGPGLTPSEDNTMQKASGHVLSSFMVGSLSNRYKARKYCESDDIHSCNFIAWKSVVKESGGWNEKYWPGEDTLLCTEMRKMNMKMIEAPDVLVYHHRRPLWIPHLSQVFGYGIHRGLFARKFGGTSLKPKYFMPSFLLVGFLSFLLCSIWSAVAFYSSLTLLSMYLLGDLLAALMQTQDPRMVPLLLAGIPLTHLTYGIAFVIGLLKDDLNR